MGAGEETCIGLDILTLGLIVPRRTATVHCGGIIGIGYSVLVSIKKFLGHVRPSRAENTLSRLGRNIHVSMIAQEICIFCLSLSDLSSCLLLFISLLSASPRFSGDEETSCYRDVPRGCEAWVV